MHNHPEWWDPWSCQPYKIPDGDKSRIRFGNSVEYGKIFLTFALLFPAVAWKYAALKPGKPKPASDLVGLSINTDKQWQSAHLEMVQDLGVTNLLVRAPGWDLSALDDTGKFMDSFPKSHEFLVNILQNRESVDRPDLWRTQIRTIVESLSHRCQVFKIGNAVNRSKWGCRHSGEALRLFEIANEIKQDYPHIRFLGSSVIDFDPLVTLRTLFNFARYNFDGCASLLYVNRRGSAYTKQFGLFDLQAKLRLNKAILQLSNNTSDNLWITEVNWPLLNTKPYTPNSGHPRSTVDEETQAKYLLEYFDIARNCGWVERVYWWQLINPGYGLVDHRSGKLRKMPSYSAFKSMFDTG